MFQIQKNNSFTFIRILCSLVVVYEHFVILTNLHLPILEIRGIAVSIFFILSGFWVTRSLILSRDLIEFYKKRVKKIFPPYLVVIFSSAILLVFLSSLKPLAYYTNAGLWKYLIANCLTLNFVHPDLPGVFNGAPVNGSLWTIKIELGFYIILPLILLMCIGRRRIYKKCVWGGERCIFVLLSIYLLSAFYVLRIPVFIEQYNLPTSIANQLPAYMNYFSTGMIMFFYYESIVSVLNKFAFVAFPVLIVSIVLRNIYVSAFLEPAALGIGVMWVALKAKPLFVFAKCYDFSYWLYLIHYPLIMVIKEYIW